MAKVVTKALDAETQKRLRTLVKKVVTEDFGGNGSNAAAALGVSQSYLSAYLNGGTGGGRKILAGLASVRLRRPKK